MSEVTPSVSNRIKRRVMDKIGALDSVQKVYGYEETNPAGFPAVMVKPTDMEGEFSSNAENSRVYSYSVLVVFYVGQDEVAESVANRGEYAEQVVATVIDEIIATMDTDFELDDSDPTVLFVNAADAQWGDFNVEAGVAKAALINLMIYTEKTIR